MIQQTISNMSGSNLDIVVLAIWGAIFLFLAYKFVQAICLVPTKSAYVVERLGKYRCTLEAGFHLLLPFIDRVAFIQDLKEETIDVPPHPHYENSAVYP